MADRTYLELKELIDASDGVRIHRSIVSMTRTSGVLARNISDFLATCAVFDEPESMTLFGDERTQERNELLHRYIQQLHNLVASVKSLVDHTRNTVRELLPEDDPASAPLLAEYHERKDAVAALPEAGFLHQLRNYLLHRKLPATTAHMRGQAEDDGSWSLTVGMCLDRDELLEWDGWSAPVREVVEEQGKEVFVEPFVRVYQAHAGDLHDWLRQQLYEDRYKDKIDELNELIREQRNVGG